MVVSSVRENRRTAARWKACRAETGLELTANTCKGLMVKRTWNIGVPMSLKNRPLRIPSCEKENTVSEIKTEQGKDI